MRFPKFKSYKLYWNPGGEAPAPDKDLPDYVFWYDVNKCMFCISAKGSDYEWVLWMGLTAGNGKSCRYWTRKRGTNDIPVTPPPPVTLWTVPPAEKDKQAIREIWFDNADVKE